MGFMWLEQWNKTPMDLGLDRDEVDPWFWQGVPHIKAGMAYAQKQQMNQSGSGS